MDDGQSVAGEVLDKLQRPVPDLQTLLALLSGPLACLCLLPPQFRRYNTTPLPDRSVNVHKHISSIQRALLHHVLPIWDTSLAEAQATPLVEQYFCPDSFSFASDVAGLVANLAYSTILSQSLTSHAIHLLNRLTAEYPVDRLHSVIFRGNQTKEIRWEDCVRNIVTTPTRVANALGERGDVPPLLEHGIYFNNVSVRCECLIAGLATKPSKGASPNLYTLMQ